MKDAYVYINELSFEVELNDYISSDLIRLSTIAKVSKSFTTFVMGYIVFYYISHTKYSSCCCCFYKILTKVFARATKVILILTCN